ncbi:hypothetical protein [Microcoleus sp. FACHB-672]|nr:hypothetical protein [Microcoleus sp. FACHB-672]
MTPKLSQHSRHHRASSQSCPVLTVDPQMQQHKRSGTSVNL